MHENKKGAAGTDQSTAAPKMNSKTIQGDFTTENSKSQGEPGGVGSLRAQILSLIGYGKENAVHLAEIISLTKTENRIVRREIELLRRSGYVIVSDPDGYYFPANAHELSRYIKRTEKTAKSIFYTLQSARKQYKQYEAEKESGTNCHSD